MKMKMKMKNILLWLKDTGIVLTAISVIFMSGRTYQTVKDLKEQIKNTVPVEQYDNDKAGEEKQNDELKESISNIDKKIDNRFECITVRLDNLYNLILSNGKEIAEKN